jgi:hypothetical protein
MNNFRSLVLGCCCCALVAAGTASAASKPAQTDRYRGADEMAAQIDKHLDAAWKAGKVTPARPAGDAAFVRRVYVDLAGRIPSVQEVRRFLADRRPDRRSRLVESLLTGPRYITHFTNVYRSLLLPEANNDFQARFQAPGFERWLRNWLVADNGYDWMVRELLTAPIAGGRMYRPDGNIAGSPGAFYSAKEFKVEEIASAVSRLFLGVNLGCAQCHNHPFASWKREQFWSFAAFFSGINVRRQGEVRFSTGEQEDRHELTIPGTSKTVKAKYLDGTQPEIKAGMKVRTILARWMTAPDNPYLARAAVNRLWAHFFGTGLIDPLDEMVGAENKSSHPAILDELARAFVEHKYDLKWLIRTITATRAYQLSSARSHSSQDEPQLFARAALRGLTAEQLYDSLSQATGFAETRDGRMRFAPFGGAGTRQEFLTKFANAADRPTETQTSILQALTLMNGRLMTTVTDLKTSETLAAIADAPFMDTRAKVEALFLAALSRKPTTKEMTRFVAYVNAGGKIKDQAASEQDKEKRRHEALADVFWALLNSSEFILNH